MFSKVGEDVKEIGRGDRWVGEDKGRGDNRDR